jgi:predicted amidohydrolase YtcJ
LTDGSWQHLVGVYDAAVGQLRLFVDGQLAASTAYTAGLWQADQQFNVGRILFTAADLTQFFDYFHGDIDQVAVFAGAMSAREVANLCDCPAP